MHFAHEGGSNTPFIAHWPARIKTGRNWFREPAHIIDVMATVAELTGAGYPEKFNGHDILPLEGISLAPVLRGETRGGHESLYWEWSGNRAMRQGKWKLVWDKLVKKWELYDLAADRTELNDLAETHPDRAKTMADAWFAWADRTGNKY